jgi:endonuclease YncB( thermonuclease family)
LTDHQPRYLQAAYWIKALHRRAFFVFTLWLWLYPLHGLAVDCQAPSDLKGYDVASVIDGDTLRLGNGEMVRLIGIDTPEVGYEGAADQPFARDAKNTLERLVNETGGRVLLQPGTDQWDRYRRKLAHLFRPDGLNLTAELLRRGMGYQAIMAPNLLHFDCYRAAEQKARRAALGLWRLPLSSAAEVVSGEAGFHLLRSRVERVGHSRRAEWLNLVGGVAIKIPLAVWQEMRSEMPESLVGRPLEVRGWFFRYKGRLRLTLTHPAAIRWL